MSAQGLQPRPYDNLADLDAPPSYEAVAGPSSSVATAPAAAAHLFSAPLSAEPALTNVEARQRGLQSIRTDDKLVSSDPKLLNPDVLYDYIRSLALRPLDTRIRLFGTHTVTAPVAETVYENGVPRQVRVGETYTVTDFDFIVPLSSVACGDGVLWTTPPGQPARRGGHALSVRTGGGDYQLGWVEARTWTKWEDERRKKGLPGWVKIHYSPGAGEISADLETQALINEEDVGLDRRALREWCEAFVRDPGYLKEFRVKRDAWGWDWDRLVSALDGAVKSTGYTGNWKVKVDNRDVATVRPNNWLSRAVHAPWIFAILCVTLVYPLIWIWQRLHRLGGGVYDVAHISYGMKSYLPLPATHAAETIPQARARLPELRKSHPHIPQDAALVAGPQGVHYLAGRKEGEWFREWEERVRMGVRMGFRGVLDDARVEVERVELDGY
ncbi:hypothetical protein Q5752_004324 [Cryptotrichosporon argae]